MAKRIKLFAPFFLAMLLFGCGNRNTKAAAPAESIPQTTVCTVSPELIVPPEALDFTYQDLALTDFLYSSGAGGWGNALYIRADGSFQGIYRDSEMADATQDYPLGTLYTCSYTGKLGTPIPVTAYAYQIPIQVLSYERVPDSQEIRDELRYCYTTALGIDGALELLLYRPHTPMSALPESFRQWVDPLGEQTELSCWAIYNEALDCSFEGSDKLQKARDSIQTAEEVAASIHARIPEDATQAEMNIAAQQCCSLWEDALATVWSVLEVTLSDDVRQRLTQQQRSWEAELHQAVTEAAAELEGGSLAPLVQADLTANMTRERVYLLLDYLPPAGTQ